MAFFVRITANQSHLRPICKSTKFNPKIQRTIYSINFQRLRLYVLDFIRTVVNIQYKVKYNERNMKLKNKDTKKYLLSVAVSTFVSYVVTFISFYGRVYYDIIETTCVCVCLLNVVTALLAWKFAKSNSKMSLLVLHWELDTLAMLPLMGFSIWAITDGTIACFFAIIQFILLGIFNLFTVGLSLAVYSFIQHKCKIRSKDINQFCL